jgi:single-strand DNA-binding protein
VSGFSINQVCISGNLTADPELRSLPSGTAVCKIRIAHNERFKDNATGEWADRANYFDVTVWGGIGEWVAREMSKGDGIVVQGRLKWREWQIKDSDRKAQAVDITADAIQPQKSGGGGGGRTQMRSEQATLDIPTDDFVPAGASTSGFTAAQGDTDDIPF